MVRIDDYDNRMAAFGLCFVIAGRCGNGTASRRNDRCGSPFRSAIVCSEWGGGIEFRALLIGYAWFRP
jgi:hypothetical protein